MAVLRSDIERALDVLISNEEGMRFQGLAVILAKLKWPELIACERKKDLGLDAYASARLSPDGIGKGLACSITPTIGKISGDATEARKHFGDVTVLIFATPHKVTNLKKSKWAAEIQKTFGYELAIMSREEIITSLMIPSNAPLCRTQLGIEVTLEETIVDLVERVRQATGDVTANWSVRTSGQPLVELRAIKLDQKSGDSAEVFHLSNIQAALAESRRIVLEAPAGRGKTTTLIQLAKQHIGKAGTGFLIDLPVWTRSRLGILQFIAGMPSFQSRSVDAGALARAHNAEHFSFLLNGWNEITESNSTEAVDALRELERTFPAAGIIVATRTHHIVPPLPGALRVRLLTLTRGQRTAYLKARLGTRANELGSKLDSDPLLDELTRTPFFLSEMTAIFEAAEPIPTTKMGVLSAVIRLLEQSDEHRNHLQSPPLFGRQHDYLDELATRMTMQGAVSISEDDARVMVSTIGVRLRDAGQIASSPEPAAVLSMLCAHHALERLEYPTVAFRFEHQQFQEFYAALGIKRQLRELLGKGREAESREFTKKYVNEPAWAEPLRMIAEEIGIQTVGVAEDGNDVQVGRLLVEMALSVDPIFAAELARLCGASVWKEVGTAVAERLRSWYAVRDEHHRHCALAGMLASGSEEFKDVIVSLLSGEDQQTRLRSYRTWSEFHVSSLGANWREAVSGWNEAARVEFVSEILHNRFIPEIASFAVADPCSKVQEAAIEGLTWIGSEDEAARLLEKIGTESFESIVQKLPPEMIPASIRQRALTSLQELYDESIDAPARLRTLLKIAELDDTNISNAVKDDLNKLPRGKMEGLGHSVIRPALHIVRQVEPEWVSHWVAERVADGSLWHENWVTLITSVPEDLKERSLQRIESRDFKHIGFRGIISVLAAGSNALLAERVFSRLCALRRTIAGAPDERHEFEWAIERQLEALFRALPVKVAIAGLSSCLSGDINATAIDVITRLFSRAGRNDSEPLNELDRDLRQNLRAYLKKSIAFVLQQDDFYGELKANLASVLALVGEPEDMGDLRTLIRADIERVRKGRAARARGDRGKLANGATMRHANWHVRAVVQLDSANADSILLDLLKEPEYELAVAEELVRLASPPKTEERFGNKVDYGKIWEARAGQLRSGFNEERRKRYTNAIRARITGLLEERSTTGQTAPYDYRLKELATALAAIDSHGSADLVLAVISLPGEWDGWRRVEAVELLLFNGVPLPAELTLTLLDSTFERMPKYGQQDQDTWMVKRFLCLLPFVDTPSKGIDKVREVLAKVRFPDYELRDVATAVGYCRCDEALDFLRELVSNDTRAKQLGDAWIKAVAVIDSPRSRSLLLSFVDPEVPGLAVEVNFDRDDVLAARIVELARRDPRIEVRLLELCDMELPSSKRLLLSKVIGWLGTPAAVSAGLNLIDDNATPSLPYEIWKQLEDTFVERRPSRQSQNTYTLVARTSNAIRAKLFEMVTKDARRKKAAFSLLGQIEEWRLEYGKPNGEPRHPAFGSVDPWPPSDPRP